MRFLILVFVFALLGSCKEEALSTVENLGASISAFEYHRVIESSTDTKIFVVSSLANFGHDGVNTNRTYIKTGHSEKSPLFTSPSLTFNEELPMRLENPLGANVLPHDSNFERLYGRGLSLSIGGNSKSVDILADYIPNLIKLEDIYEYPLEITESKIIKWNEDENNTHPVYLIIRYSPQENPGLAESFPHGKVAFIAMPDDGSYVFSKSDFPNIPEQSVAVMTLVRGVGDVTKIVHNSIESSLSFTVSSMTNGFIRFY
jgi:hypothetical protein